MTTDKVIGQDGKFWGHDAEIGMSRKVYWWFELAMRLFPTTPYFPKGDDDMFLDAPQFITDLRRFTRRGLYWGDVVISRAGFYFVTGGLYTMSRDVVEQFLTFEPVRRMIDVPYTAELDANFTRYSMEHEDLLVGHVLHLRKYKDLVFIKDSQCRFHNLHGNCCTAPLTRRSMMIHNVKEWEYAWVKDKQSDESRLQPKRFWRWGKLGLITYC
ncbi:hypothetical protein ERJ75_000361600 [Trypanosoma vivax]|nr:hypothetical protein ERJ75_000361600 [Trypanosoma vivax]